MAAVPKESVSTSKPSRPKRDEFELIELGEKLVESEAEKKTLSFSIWKRNDPLKGKVIKLDPSTQRVHIQTQFEGIHKVLFIDILKVADVE